MTEDEHLLARIDERVRQMQAELHDFVTRAEFAPVKMLTFGIAALILSTVVATLLAKVLVH